MEKLDIVRARGEQDIEFCAQWMARSEPWTTLDMTYRALRARISDPLGEAHVALIDDEATGLVVLFMHGALRGYIQLLGVHPDWRNIGIGKRLLAFAERRIFRESPNVFICVSSFNTDALRFYEQQDYEVIGELTDYLIKGYSEFLLRKTTGPILDFDSGRSHSS